MGTQPPTLAARPLPSVIQRARGHESGADRDQHARVSFSSASCSSNHASGESWFQPSRSLSSSNTSHSSHAPLPKGARAPSPQLAQHDHIHPSPHHTRASQAHKAPPSLSSSCRSSSFSWKIDWRGVSKVVKWVVLGEQPYRTVASSPSKGRSRSSHSQSRSDPSRRAHHHTRPQGSRTAASKHQAKPLPSKPARPKADSAFLEDRFPSLSHSTSSAVNLPRDRPRYPVLHSQSDSGHGSTGNVAGTSSPPYSSHLRTPLPPSTSRHVHGSILDGSGGHVSRHSLTSNVQSEQGHAYSELEHLEVADVRYGSRYSVSEIGHPSVARPYESVPALPATYTRSDIGHTSTSRMPGGALSPMLSSTFLSGYASYMNVNATASKAFPSAAQSAIALSVSTESPYPPSAFENQRPRKLRKSTGIRTPSDAGHTSCSSGVASEPSWIVPSSSSYFSTTKSASSSPEGPPPRPPPKPSRKLTKRNSAPSSPVLQSARSASSAHPSPPPVPAKSSSVLKVNLLSAPPLSTPAYPSLHANRRTLPVNQSSPSCDDSHEGAFVSSPESMTSSYHGCAGINRASKRPSFLRTESNRRWTVAVADVPDDMLVAELDRLRRMGMRAGEVHGVPSSEPSDADFQSNNKHCEFQEKNGASTTVGEDEDEIEWGYARRAILCCRELVRTERSYLARLQDLYDGNISDEVPKLVLQYLPDLISASRLLSSLFAEDPSAVGVSSAFIQAEPVLENTFIAWTGVVGEFFIGDASMVPLQKHVRSATISHVTQQQQQRFVVDEPGRKVKTKSNVRTMSMQERMHFSPTTTASSSSGSSPAQSRSNSQSRRRMSFSGAGSMQWLFRPAPPSGSSVSDGRESFTFSLRKSLGRTSRKSSSEKRRRTLFREFAILPTQRVTRYVLLYKDLLKYTPLTSPARGVVERAVSSAQNLAQKCDKAQRNAAFLYNS